MCWLLPSQAAVHEAGAKSAPPPRSGLTRANPARPTPSRAGRALRGSTRSAGWPTATAAAAATAAPDFAAAASLALCRCLIAAASPPLRPGCDPGPSYQMTGWPHTRCLPSEREVCRGVSDDQGERGRCALTCEDPPGTSPRGQPAPELPRTKGLPVESHMLQDADGVAHAIKGYSSGLCSYM